MNDLWLNAFIKCVKAIMKNALKNCDDPELKKDSMRRRLRRRIIKKTRDLISSNKNFSLRFYIPSNQVTTRLPLLNVVQGELIISDKGPQEGRGKRGAVKVMFRKVYGGEHKLLVDYFTNQDERDAIVKRFNGGKIVPVEKPAWFNNRIALT